MLFFHGSGSKDGYITFSAYGTGKTPTILGSESRSSIHDWIYQNNDIWETGANNPTNPEIGAEVGNIIFFATNGTEVDTSTGVRVFNSLDLNSQGKFISDVAEQKGQDVFQSKPCDCIFFH